MFKRKLKRKMLLKFWFPVWALKISITIFFELTTKIYRNGHLFSIYKSNTDIIIAWAYGIFLKSLLQFKRRSLLNRFLDRGISMIFIIFIRKRPRKTKFNVWCLLFWSKSNGVTKMIPLIFFLLKCKLREGVCVKSCTINHLEQGCPTFMCS